MSKSLFDDVSKFIDTHAELADEFTRDRLSLSDYSLTKTRDENKGSSTTFKQEIVHIDDNVVHVRSAKGRRYPIENSKFCNSKMVKVGDTAIVKRVVSNTPPHMAYYLIGVEGAGTEKVLAVAEAEQEFLDLGGDY